MSKRQTVLVVDVETAGGFGCPLVYDLGFAVVEIATGNILEARSLIVHDVFFGMKNKMRTAYYADKVPTYYKGIRSGAHKVVRFATAKRIVSDLMGKYGIHKVYAYNCAFDKGALASTASKTIGGDFFPANTEYCDIWHMACQTIMRQAGFRKFATANGFISDAGNFRTSAEVCYAYITNEPTFTEEHTGLADVHIEVAILHRVMRQKKRVNHAIVHNPWRIPQVA